MKKIIGLRYGYKRIWRNFIFSIQKYLPLLFVFLCFIETSYWVYRLPLVTSEFESLNTSGSNELDRNGEDFFFISFYTPKYDLS